MTIELRQPAAQKFTEIDCLYNKVSCIKHVHNRKIQVKIWDYQRTSVLVILFCHLP